MSARRPQGRGKPGEIEAFARLADDAIKAVVLLGIFVIAALAADRWMVALAGAMAGPVAGIGQ